MVSTQLLALTACQALAVAAIAYRWPDIQHWFGAQPRCGSPAEYVIVSRQVVTPDGIFPAAVQVKKGLIRRIAPINISAQDARANLTRYAHLLTGLTTVLDFGNLTVMPGVLDTHVHQPGRADWEGFRSASRAAAAGGVTTFVDMPLNNDPATTTAALLGAKRRASKGKLWVDAGFWGGLVPANARDPAALRALLDAGALGLKAFLCPSGINDFPNASLADVAAALPVLAAAGAPLLVHAELADGAAPQGDPRAHATWAASRPPAWERAAVAALLGALRQAGGAGGRAGGFALHVAHVSDVHVVEMLRKARAEGLPVTAETCPHYLTFADEDVPIGATAFKCAPPLRGAANREALWAALAGGGLDSVASDHSPAPPALKLAGEGDFVRAWGGIAGLQYLLPATWDGARRRGVPLERVAGVLAAAPAALAGLARCKGALAAGLDADIVVWDPDALADTSPAALHHRHPLTPYAGLPLRGRVAATFVRGQQVFAAPGARVGFFDHLEVGTGLSRRACGRPMARCTGAG